MSFSVPVALLVFNRPDSTRQMFETVRQRRPATLLVIADGPRPDRADDIPKCEDVRRIVRDIDWPCDLRINFAESNMGLKARVNSGLSWVFDEVERAVILEDDCIPDPTFFPYCEALLDHYADDQRVMSISGNNFLFGGTPIIHSYYYSRHMHCWGWATWRRAWKLHDPAMPQWRELKNDGWLESFVTEGNERRYWHNTFDAVHDGQINTWDVQWNYSILRHNGLCINPSANLVSNIGFTAEATHTTQPTMLENVARVPMAFPLMHPPHVLRNFFADDHYGRLCFPPRRKFVW